MTENPRNRSQITPVTFRGIEIEEDLKARIHSPYDSLGSVAKRDLERYYSLLKAELATVDLSQNEALLICDCLNGTLMEAHTMRLLWAEIDDAIRLDGLGAKWGVVGPALVAKLRSLTAGQTTAIVDAAERFWARNDSDESNSARLEAVGLTAEKKEETK